VLKLPDRYSDQAKGLNSRGIIVRSLAAALKQTLDPWH